VRGVICGVTASCGRSPLRAVHDLARAAQGAHAADELLERLCDRVAETFGFERVAVERHVEGADDLRTVAARGMALHSRRGSPRSVRDRMHIRSAFDQQEIVFVEDERREPGKPADNGEVRACSAVAVPLVIGDRRLGVLSADRGGETFALDESEVELLATFAALAATFLDKAIVHDRLVRLDEEKSGFIALASHELRRPIAVIAGVSATLHMRGNDLREDQAIALRTALYEQSERTRALVDQLLDLSRLDAGSVRIRPERVRVRPWIEDLVLLVARERAIDVALEIPRNLEALVDPHTLDRVVSNLLANALRYGEAPITVAARRRGRKFRLAVEDSGPGIPPAFVPRLFDRFARSDRSPQQASGAGLGLSIAQSYAHAHGGELSYEPAKPHGARFELVLPATPS
jgi:signal transduction histidine kinase